MKFTSLIAQLLHHYLMFASGTTRVIFSVDQTYCTQTTSQNLHHKMLAVSVRQTKGATFILMSMA